MKSFSSRWKSSKKPKKQRKYSFEAPLHIKGKFLHAHLSKELSKKYGTRSLRVASGDKVKIMRGSLKKQEGKVESVDIKRGLLHIEKIDMTKKEGSVVKIPVRPSRVLIVEINSNDKKRMERLQAGIKRMKPAAPAKAKEKIA